MTGAAAVTPGRHPLVVSLLTVAEEGAGGKVVGCGSCRLPPEEEKRVEALPSPCLDQEQTPAPCSARPPRGAGSRCFVPRAGRRSVGDAGPVGCFYHGLGIAMSLLHPPAAVMAFPTQPHCVWPSAPHHAAVTCHREHFLNRANHSLNEA